MGGDDVCGVCIGGKGGKGSGKLGLSHAGRPPFRTGDEVSRAEPRLSTAKNHFSTPGSRGHVQRHTTTTTRRPTINNPNSPFLTGPDYSPLHIDLFTIAYHLFKRSRRHQALAHHPPTETKSRISSHTPEQNLPPTATMSKTFTKADVATHKDEAAGMYIIIDDGVYNITGTWPLPPFHPVRF